MSKDAIRTSATKRAWGLARPALGVSLGGAHTRQQVDRRRDWIGLAESLKLHSVWLPEMHFSPGGCSAPLVELAEFAAMTKRLRLGTTSLLLPLHPPEQIAAEIAALDQLSGGRLLIGLGRGFNRKMLDAFEVPPAEKRDRFDAALDRILALWAEGNRNDSALATHQKPHPPLAVAAFGPKGLAQAARHGLPYLASPVETLDQIAENQAQHRAQLSSEEPLPLSLIMRTVFVSQDQAELVAVREVLGEEIAGRRAHLPAAVRTALEAPLSERAIIGTSDEVIESLRSMRARIGFDLLIVRPQITKTPDEALERSLQCLAEEVWPAVIGETTIAA